MVRPALPLMEIVLNVSDLSTSVSVVALNGVDDGVSSSTSDGNGLNASNLSTSVSSYSVKQC